MNISETKSHTKFMHRRVKEVRSPRKPIWRPEATGLSRDELRAIVADMLG